jgi:DNA repair exonuclease SbcCD ATPase subunit
MELALEIAFAAAVIVVAASLAAVAFARVRERLLLGLSVGLGVLALLGGIVAGIAIAEGTADTELLLVTVGGLILAALAETGLFLLTRGLRRIRAFDQVETEARARLEAYLEQQTGERKAELERIVARERANTGYVLGEQERQLAEERRDSIARQAEHARVELTEAVADAQGRLETRLGAWAVDLDRGQRELEAQLNRLGQRQKEALAEYDARLSADAERLAAASEEQKKALVQLRAEFERLITQFVEEGRTEVEAHAAERRAALHEVSERLRGRERGLREQIDREEVDSRARVAQGLAEAERRQLAQLDKALDRAASRLSEDAERRFDTQIKQSREKSAERLSRELEKSIEEFVRQAESEVSDRIVQLARQTADRMERRLRDVARAAEAQGDVAGERLRHVSERLDAALAAAEQRISAYEEEVDVRLDAKLGHVERAVKAVERE